MTLIVSRYRCCVAIVYVTTERLCTVTVFCHLEWKHDYIHDVTHMGYLFYVKVDMFAMMMRCSGGDSRYVMFICIERHQLWHDIDICLPA